MEDMREGRQGEEKQRKEEKNVEHNKKEVYSINKQQLILLPIGGKLFCCLYCGFS